MNILTKQELIDTVFDSDSRVLSEKSIKKINQLLTANGTIEDKPITLKLLCEILGINKVTYYRKMKKYGLSINRAKFGQKMTEELYEEIIKDNKVTGASIRSILKKHDISPKTFYRYKKQRGMK